MVTPMAGTTWHSIAGARDGEPMAAGADAERSGPEPGCAARHELEVRLKLLEAQAADIRALLNLLPARLHAGQDMALMRIVRQLPKV